MDKKSSNKKSDKKKLKSESKNDNDDNKKLRKDSNDRFNKINIDPKFKPIPKKVHKVQLDDNRFNAMFKDKNFISSAKTDEYGYKVQKGKKGTIEMDKYYQRNKSEESSENEEEQEEQEEKEDKKLPKKSPNKPLPKENKEKKQSAKKESINEEEEQEESESDTSEEFQEFLNDQIEQEEQEDEESENENNENIENNENNNTQKQEKNNKKSKTQPIPLGEATSRFAVMNIDWDNFRAIDLFILFSSFCSGKKSQIKKVEIYPSEYGIKEQRKENEQGPDKEIFNDSPELDQNPLQNDPSSNAFNQIKLREYELKKLKYYYAVVTCDSIETANNIYTICDGQEIEKTQNFMDLRFIPDSLTSFPYPPKDTCDHIPHDFNYVPNFRNNSALQDTKVKFTWDEGDKRREELLEKAFKKNQFNMDDYEELLASSDSDDLDDDDNIEEDDDNDNKNELNLLRHKRKMPKFKDGETIEIKFNKGFGGINEGVKGDGDDEGGKSKWEKFKDNKKNKRREKKMEERKRREEVKNKRKGGVIGNKEGDKGKNVKKMSKQELDLLVDKTIKTAKPFKFNPDDERFNTKDNVDFAIDPTSKEYKKIKKGHIS